MYSKHLISLHLRPFFSGFEFSDPYLPTKIHLAKDTSVARCKMYPPEKDNRVFKINSIFQDGSQIKKILNY